jgi:hypothetical protein
MKIAPIIIIVLLLIGCTKSTISENSTLAVADSAAIQTAREAYIFAIPLVIMDITRRQSIDPASSMYAPLNTFRHNSDFPDASFRNVVRPNADTYYSTAILDLTDEPLVLSLPDTKGRYYMMPMLDAYSNVFASPGTRTTGNKAGNFLIVGPQWNGVVPSDMNEIKAPTNAVWIIGRTQVNSKADGATVVVPLQKQYKLTPLSTWSNAPLPKKRTETSPPPKGDPNSIVAKFPLNDYFTYVNELLARNPPPIADKEALDRFASIGVGPGKKFDLETFSTPTQTALTKIPETIFGEFQGELTATQSLVNGWNVGRKIIGTYGTNYHERASVAFFGLGANIREDAIYPSCVVDENGNVLNGENKYLLHFDKGKTPHANAFWSLTMYDADGYFIKNPINRYAIGDRSNLKINGDGSIDIFIQKDNPGKAKEANWLPAPSGVFNLLMRVYWPKKEMIEGTWSPPAVKKLN